MKIQEITPIILASQSPRRREIMRRHGIDVLVHPTDTDETLPDSIEPEDAVQLLSAKKALACLESLNTSDFPSGLIVAADTIVYKDEILGKPVDEEDAFHMLSLYRGTFHKVMTGVTILDIASRKQHSFCETTLVHCRNYSDEEILEYIRTAKPFDKAGAYGIQESFSEYIESYEGDYENVVGLPYERLSRETERFFESYLQ